MKVSELNALPWQDAKQWFTQTCAAQRWAEKMTDGRPYSDIASVLSYAETHWQSMGKDDFLEAFSAHPMIGDINSLRSKFANTRSLAAGEQSGTARADEKTLYALKKDNEAYLNKHGFIFIICATGLTAGEMLEALRDRLANSTEEEIRRAAAQQLKITKLRIEKGLTNKGQSL